MAGRKTPPKPPAPPPEIIEDETVPERKDRRPWYIALLVAGLLVLGVSTYFALSGTMPEWEQRLFTAVNNVDAPEWVTERVAKPMSNAVWGMSGLVVLLLLVPKFRLRAWQYAVAGASTYVVVYALEHLVGRGRPMDMPYEFMLRAMQGGPGFPSGHVAVMTALGLTIWPYVRWPWRILILVFIGAEAWARVFLGVHAPLDVIGAMGVAAVVVAVIHLLPAVIRKFFKISA